MSRECLTTHEMKLDPVPFAMIRSGEKTIELRLFDQKRRRLRVGDEIVFINNETAQQMRTKVVKLHLFESFAALYEALPLLQCGYTPQDVGNAAPEDMEAYYSPEQQKAYGVVGIELSLK